MPKPQKEARQSAFFVVIASPDVGITLVLKSQKGAWQSAFLFYAVPSNI
jgi:hypothetical protein